MHASVKEGWESIVIVETITEGWGSIVIVETKAAKRVNSLT
jgi:hypothetical protein